MPMASLGGVISRPSNYSAWLSAAVGGRALDTALSYGKEVQTQVGEAFASSGLARSEVFLTTKIPCCPDGVPKHTEFSCSDPSAGNATQALERDLRELGVDAVDLVLLHWPCTDMTESVTAYRALEAFYRQGKTRAIGVR